MATKKPAQPAGRQINVSTFEFLDPKSKREFEFFGTVAGALLQKHSQSKHYLALVKAFTEELFTEETPEALFKPAEDALGEVHAKRLDETREKKVKIKYARDEGVDDDYMVDGCGGTKSSSTKKTGDDDEDEDEVFEEEDEEEDAFYTEEDLKRLEKERAAKALEEKAKREEQERLDAKSKDELEKKRKEDEALRLELEEKKRKQLEEREALAAKERDAKLSGLQVLKRDDDDDGFGFGGGKKKGKKGGRK